MNLSVSISMAQRSDKSEPSNHPNSLDPLLKWSGDFDRGWEQEIELRPGFRLSISDFNPPEDILISFEFERAPLGFGFVVSGTAYGTVDGGRGQEIFIDYRQGVSFITFFPNLCGISRCSGGRPVRTVGIYVDPLLLNTFLGEQLDSIPDDFRSILDGSDNNHYYYSRIMTPSMQIAVHQIFNCPYQGFTRRMYLESKALELISLQLSQLVFGRNGPVKPPVLRPDDIERIRHARDILIDNIQNPPTIRELARTVAINEFKLKQGFRQTFGTTVFGYLQDYRFETTRLLLEENCMNVSEVAFTVGYSDIKHFYDSFKKRFGITPGAYRRKV